MANEHGNGVGIAAAAKACGVHRSTLRRWEQRGLVHPRRTWARHRRYTPGDISRLRELAGLEPDRIHVVGRGSASDR